MTVFGSFCTRSLINRTLICNAILYHFQITLTCGRTNRRSIPLTLFLLSRPLEQLEFIRLSNFVAESCFEWISRPQRFMLPRNLQSRYRRHLAHSKLLFQIPRARRSLNQLSRLTIHLVQEFKIGPIQSRKNVFETNIIVIHDQTPQISLPHSSFLRSRCSRSRRHDDAVVFFFFFSFFFFLSRRVSLSVLFVLCFSSKTKNWRFGGKREKKRNSQKHHYRSIGCQRKKLSQKLAFPFSESKSSRCYS